MNRVAAFSSPFLLGFDEIEKVLDRVSRSTNEGYPPYNIERFERNGKVPERLRITLAVAGFTREELDIALADNELTIQGRQIEDEETRDYLHRGIAKRHFQRVFVLAEGIEVEKAGLRDGLLEIELRRIEPERKVRQIEIA